MFGMITLTTMGGPKRRKRMNGALILALNYKPERLKLEKWCRIMDKAEDDYLKKDRQKEIFIPTTGI